MTGGDQLQPLGIPVSLLDVVPVTARESSADALDRARELARLGDQLGYHRLWYAEHHSMPGIASTAPEVLVANAAAITRRIRVGSGGVMLPNHSPLTVAERYATLDALHPGRIDLGVGRAPGTDRRTMLALRRGPATTTLPSCSTSCSAICAGSRPTTRCGDCSPIRGRSNRPPWWCSGRATTAPGWRRR